MVPGAVEAPVDAPGSARTRKAPGGRGHAGPSQFHATAAPVVQVDIDLDPRA